MGQSEPLGLRYLNLYQRSANPTERDIDLGCDGSLTQHLRAIYPSIVLLYFKRRADLRAAPAHPGHLYHGGLALVWAGC